jgi:hypothetical protein
MVTDDLLKAIGYVIICLSKEIVKLAENKIQ